MAKIIVQILVDTRHGGSYQTCEGAEIHLGRGFDNDVIINDPFVNEQHAVLTTGEDGRISLRDLGSKNGTFSLPLKRQVETAEVTSGEEFLLGKTRIRVFLPSHAVVPARPLRGGRFTALIKKTYVAWGLLIIVMALSTLEGYFNTITNEQLGKLLIYPVGVLISGLVWGCFWGFIGRLIIHEYLFSLHLSIFCLWFLAGNALDLITDYITFYANSLVLTLTLEYAIFFVSYLIVFPLTLSLVSNLSARARLISSTIFTLVVLLGSLGIRYSYYDEYLLGSPFNASLKPPVFGSPKGHPAGTFLEKSQKLFVFKDK